MKRRQLLDYLIEIEKLGKIRDESNIMGDYKSGNRAYKKIEKNFELVKESSDKEKFYLNILNSSYSASTLTTCCAHMMKLGIHPDITRKKLEEIKNSKEYYPILAFNADMFLKEWDKGNIKY